MKAPANNQTILVFSNVWIEPNSSAAGWRMIGLIRCFYGLGYKIHYATTAAESSRAVFPSDMHIRFHQIKVNDDAVDDLIQSIAPDLVLFDRFMVEEQFGWRVATVCPDAVRILDMEDMHSLRYAREAAIIENRQFHPSDLNKREITYRELASIHRCDLTLVISSYEYTLLHEHFGLSESLLCYLPFTITKDEVFQISALPSYNQRTGFISIGNFRHAPNRDAVMFLKEKLWPIIHAAIPHAQLNIYGAYPDKRMLQLHKPSEGFYVHGAADNLREVLVDARVLLAPLRFGAGLKGKLVDAMRYGLPSVTTPVGSEGIADVGNWPGAVEQGLEELANAAIAIYQNESLWQQAQLKIENVISSRFINPQFEQEMLRKLFEIGDNIERHRQQNWIGGMLQMNSQKSYTYLSKWIMAKHSA